MRKNKKLAINLLSFSSNRLAGTGYFAKRIFEKIESLPGWDIIILASRHCDVVSVFNIPNSWNAKIITVPFVENRFFRIFFEQLILPFYCIFFDLIFSPCVANPVFLFKCKSIVTIHDLAHIYYPLKYGWLQSFYISVISRLLAKFSDKIITVSENSKNDIVKNFKVSPEKITTVYNFLDPASPVCDESTGIEDYFLCVSTIQPGKNIDGLIRAFKIFCDKFDHKTSLLLVGGYGWGVVNIETLIESLQLKDRVKWLGYISDADLSVLYKKCKANIYVSFYEGFGIPPLEALMYGKPSIVSSVSSLPEVVGKTGILVDPHNLNSIATAMHEIATAPELYLNGIDKQLEKFSAKKQVSKFVEVIQSFR